MKPYYYVYNYGNQAPRIRHATLAEAQAEAERLAVKHPGLCFEILQCVGFASTSKATTFWADGCEPKKNTELEPDGEWYYHNVGDMVLDSDEALSNGRWRKTRTYGFNLSYHEIGTYRRKIK